jgi:hypothetical protein
MHDCPAFVTVVLWLFCIFTTVSDAVRWEMPWILP